MRFRSSAYEKLDPFISTVPQIQSRVRMTLSNCEELLFTLLTQVSCDMESVVRWALP
jgi:hypothetical protein